ncbi:S-adenosyl-L-methionine-dependent methyltransferase, partial [Phakopsora pachyrhizi]
FWVEKLKKEAPRNWDIFYKTHSNHFFKDRNWTTQVFEVLKDKELDLSLDEKGEDLITKKVLLEVGCGVGNFIWPLLENSNVNKIYCFDFSPRAIEILKRHEKFDSNRIKPFVYDLTADDYDLDKTNQNLTQNLGSDFGSIDLISCIFVLSAIPPDKIQLAVKRLVSVLKPGGEIIIRDYAINDASQLRFHSKKSSSYSTHPSKLSKSLPFYRRSDSTLTYFFNIDEISNLFCESNNNDGDHDYIIKTLECQIIKRSLINRKSQIDLDRHFIQARFKKLKK